MMKLAQISCALISLIFSLQALAQAEETISDPNIPAVTGDGTQATVKALGITPECKDCLQHIADFPLESTRVDKRPFTEGSAALVNGNKPQGKEGSTGKKGENETPNGTGKK